MNNSFYKSLSTEYKYNKLYYTIEQIKAEFKSRYDYDLKDDEIEVGPFLITVTPYKKEIEGHDNE